MKAVRTKKSILILILLILVIVWAVYVISFNRRIKALDEVPAANYSMGEYVTFDDNYSYGNEMQGFEMKADSYQIWDTSEYLAKYGREISDFDQSFLTEKVCTVDITVRYNGSKADAIFEPLSFFMCGQDYYDGQNNELFAIANPKSEGATEIVFHPGDECAMTLVFNLRKVAYTDYNWEHLDDLERMIYMTAMPVQKNIVLHS